MLLDKLHLGVHQLKLRQMVLPLDHVNFQNKDRLRRNNNQIEENLKKNQYLHNASAADGRIR